MKPSEVIEGRRLTTIYLLGLLMYLILAVLPACGPRTGGEFTPQYSSTVFTPTATHVYFAPSGIIVNQQIYVFAEKREAGHNSDYRPTDIVYKISDDMGKTWGEEQPLLLKKDTVSWYNPSPVFASGKIIVLLTGRDPALNPVCRGGRDSHVIYQATSDDLGQSWSIVDRSPDLYVPALTITRPSPSNGVVYGNRIIMPGYGWANRECTRVLPYKDSSYHAFWWYSDDAGQTWSVSELAPAGTNENAIAIKDNQLLMSIRDYNVEYRRSITTYDLVTASLLNYKIDYSYNAPLVHCGFNGYISVCPWGSRPLADIGYGVAEANTSKRQNLTTSTGDVLVRGPVSYSNFIGPNIVVYVSQGAIKLIGQ